MVPIVAGVGDVVRTVVAAAGVFVGTNVDDLVVLTILFLSARATGRPYPWQIWTGQYAGVGALVLVSALAAAGLRVVPDRWVGLLGLIPLALGIRGLLRRAQTPAPVATSLLAVAGVTIANGADNISVYTPLFRTIGVTRSLVSILVFAVGVAAWCLAGSWLGSHQKVMAVVRQSGHWVVPAVFVLIGTIVILQSL
jgi:cadmium resistance protein CadD (predicted permease)